MIELDPPNQLSFHRPFTQLVKEVLVVRNPNTEPVAFKVKTTAPKQYCVRPNSGRIEANQSVEVQVILQPMKEDPPPNFKCKDKFLVQSIAIAPERETLSLTELWSLTEQQEKDKIKENKIRCAYLPPIETNLPPASPPPNLPLPPKPSSSAYPASPKKDTSNGLRTENVKEEKRDQSPPPSYKAHDERNSVSEKPNGTVTDRSIPTNGHSTSRSSSMIGAFPDDNKEDHSEESDPAKLRRQVLEAEEKIKRLNHTIDGLKQELNTAQMRQRKNEEAVSNRNSGIGGFSVKTQEKIPEGYYPFEVVVAAAVGAFLFGVMFF